MKKKNNKNYLLSFALSITILSPIKAQNLLQGFMHPGNEARPRVWWHWLNGNITQDGIRKDLAWMQRAGIGGVHNFDAGLLTPQMIPERLTYMTENGKRHSHWLWQQLTAWGWNILSLLLQGGVQQAVLGCR